MWSEPATQATRVPQGRQIVSFWNDAPVTAAENEVVSPFTPPAPSSAARAATRTPHDPEPEGRPSFAELEREAFMKGYAQGERSGAEAAAHRGEATLRRLAQTVEDLAGLRTELILKTERQVVELALGIAARVLHREIALDRELLVAMARIALERLGENTAATIRLNPEDYALIGAKLQASDSSMVRVVADPLVSSGGCLVQSDFGLIDVGIDAQIGEMASALAVSAPGRGAVQAARGAA
jgi:flagellar assembly protein FliH